MNQTTETDPIPEKIGPYPIQRRVGRGAMAEVFEGYDAEHSRRVAIKVLSEDLVRDKDALQRIERETKILELIRNPHVAQLLGHGRADDGRPYLVFELVLGHTLTEIIRDGNTPDWETGVKWMTQAAEALDEAWKNHIIHRDIKPGNMMIDQQDNLRLLDFGLAKALHSNDDESKPRILLGTPRYISPEMGLGQSLDYRADMYSLGATFYHLFLRQAPFDAPSLMALVMAHTNQPLVPPYSIDPTLPQDISDILEKLLKKDPSQRYQDYSDLISDLREARLAIASAAGRPLDPGGFSPAKQGAPSRLEGPDNRRPPIRIQAFEARPEVAGMAASPSPYRHLALAFILTGATALVVVLFAMMQAQDRVSLPDPEIPVAIPKIKLLSPLAAPRVSADRLMAENRDRMQRVMSIIIQYEIDRQRLPSGLGELVQNDMASEELVRDAWGNKFTYQPSDGKLISAGADGKVGSEDDFELDTGMRFTRQPDGTQFD